MAAFGVAYQLGDAECGHVGLDPLRLRLAAIGTAALLSGAAVAHAGQIAFVGLAVPHLVRLIQGPGHRALLPAAALGGGVLLLTADLVARTSVSPAELPIGLVTAGLGAPYLLLLIRREARC
jgi:iron complex transport system permease protein